MKKNYYSTIEAAKILHMSRIGVFKRIKSGKIKADRAGKNYIISHESLSEALGNSLGQEKKEGIERALRKGLKEYKNTFKLLGKE